MESVHCTHTYTVDAHSIVPWFSHLVNPPVCVQCTNLFNCNWARQLPGKSNEMQPDLSNTRAIFNFCFAAKVQRNFPCCLQNERSKKKTNKLPKKTLYVSLVSFLEKWKCNFLQGEARDPANGSWLHSFLHSVSLFHSLVLTHSLSLTMWKYSFVGH